MRRRRGQVPAPRRRGRDDPGRAVAAVLRARDALGVLRADGVHRRPVGDAEARPARRAGIEFLCSPFSLEAVERLERIGVVALQGRLRRGDEPRPRAAAAAATGKPVLLSSGMCSWAELDAAVEAAGDQVTVLQCTSQYPTPPERVGLNVLARAARALRQARRPLRPHARALRGVRGGGARRVGGREALHALASDLYGPDAALATRAATSSRSSSTACRELETMLASPVDKDDLAAVRRDEAGVREVASSRRARFRPAPDLAARWSRPRSRARGFPRGVLAEVVGRAPRATSPPTPCSPRTDARVRKVCVVVGSRANYSSIKSAMRAIADAPRPRAAARRRRVRAARPLRQRRRPDRAATASSATSACSC